MLNYGGNKRTNDLVYYVRTTFVYCADNTKYATIIPPMNIHEVPWILLMSSPINFTQLTSNIDSPPVHWLLINKQWEWASTNKP